MLYLEVNTNTGSLIFIGVLLVLLIISPILLRVKNKRDMDTAQKMLDALKKGDEVITASGVIGKIVSIDTKIGYKTVTIETGDAKHKGYQTLDINAIYMNLSSMPQQNVVSKPEEVVEEPAQEETPVQEETKVEETPAVEEVKEEKPVKERKPRTKKSSKK